MKIKLYILPIWFSLIIWSFLFCDNTFGQVFVMGNSEQQCLEGNGDIQEHSITVKSFRAVSISGAFVVKIDADSKLQDITVRADKNLQPFVAINNKSGVLEIKASRSICSKNPIEIDIKAATIDSLFSDGANDVYLENLASKRFDVKLDGSGAMKVSGKTDLLKVVISGSSGFRAKELHAQNVNIISNGSSEASIFVAKELKAQSSGVSEIVYFGEPQLWSVDEKEASEIRAGASR